MDDQIIAAIRAAGGSMKESSERLIRSVRRFQERYLDLCVRHTYDDDLAESHGEVEDVFV